ncbi:MAG: serine hydrolase, partial [Acidobacteriaceae bacterium]|nr:serine hydrolase [Acidobacteriaceae bacterium]
MKTRIAAPLVLASALACLAAPGPETMLILDSRVHEKIDHFRGSVSLYAKNLRTGISYGIRENEPVRTASTIKLAIMIECFFEMAEGKLSPKQPVAVTADAKVSGAGIVQDMSNADLLPISDLIDFMIVLSDNTATNLILSHVNGDAVNERMARLGLDNTRVMRKIGGGGETSEGQKAENKKWGIGRSTPREMVIMLEKLYSGELVSKQASEDMLATLERQRERNCIGRDMKEVTIANKTVALDHLRSDVGIIYSRGGPIAMAFTVDDMPEVKW